VHEVADSSGPAIGRLRSVPRLRLPDSYSKRLRARKRSMSKLDVAATLDVEEVLRARVSPSRRI